MQGSAPFRARLRENLNSAQRAFAILVFAGLSSAVAIAQVATASIHGQIMDSTGAVITGVTITVTNTQTGNQHRLETDAKGRYRAPELQIGDYEIKAEKQE